VLPIASWISPSSGQPVATNFTLVDISKRKFSLSDFRGKIVLLDFFAVWCKACKEEIPHLKALANRYLNNTLVMISIDIDPVSDTEQAVRKLVNDYNMTWIVVPPTLETAGVANKYEILELPTLILIDEQGFIQRRHVGVTDEEILRLEMEMIIPEFEAPVMIVTLAIASALLLLRGGQTSASHMSSHRRQFPKSIPPATFTTTLANQIQSPIEQENGIVHE
jgi:thiol-disulfide isomerase/thioredoxin